MRKKDMPQNITSYPAVFEESMWKLIISPNKSDVTTAGYNFFTNIMQTENQTKYMHMKGDQNEFFSNK